MTYMPDLSIPTFYLTTHLLAWLWNGSADYPVMVSHRRLRDRKKLKPATVPSWALDSGGFMELTEHGRWTIPARDYVAAVARYDVEIGELGWAAAQDWMCEPEVIYGGRIDGRTVPGTGLTEHEHQVRSTESLLELEALWPEYSDAESPFMPPLQGYSPSSYQKHAAMYAEYGVALTDYPLVTIGSVCRRSSTGAIADVARAVGEMAAELPPVHWFGVKLTGIKTAAISAGEVEIGGEWWEAGAGSLDSASWSYSARRNPRLPECTHTGNTGQLNNCANCPAYAARWREKAVAALYAARGTEVEPVLF